MIKQLRPTTVVDARIAKRNLGTTINDAPLVIGFVLALQPGWMLMQLSKPRGHRLGRVIYSGGAIPDTGCPGSIDGHTWGRLLKAPVDGTMRPCRSIGEQVKEGDVVAYVDTEPVRAGISGLIRGMLKEGVRVPRGTKIGDIDPRKDAEYNTISDKALAVGGGVLEAVFHFLAAQEES